MINDKIPGVYSKIDASAALRPTGANDYVIAIVAKATTEDSAFNLTNKPYAPVSYDDAKTKFGADSNIVKIMDVAMENGGSKFIVVRVGDDELSQPDYLNAFKAIELEEAVDIILTDTMSPTDFADIKTNVRDASENRRERMAVVGFDSNTDMTTVQSTAQTINTGRILTAYPNGLDREGNEVPGYLTAAAIAGQLAGESDPSMPLTGVELKGFYGLAKKLKDDEIVSLIDSGIIPLETRNGTIRIVRCITTYTKDEQGKRDITWQEVTTVRISDYIFKDLRADLTRRFQRAKQNKDTRDSIRSRVISKLLEYEGFDYIENVDEKDVTIAINPNNPLRNDLNFKYDVTGPLNIINLIGHLVI